MTAGLADFGLATASVVMTKTPFAPAEAGAQNLAKTLGPRFRGDERDELVPMTQRLSYQLTGHFNCTIWSIFRCLLKRITATGISS